MSLSNATVWEVRPTVGSATNGGGFVAGASGTDFSQQNAANSGGNNSSTTDAVGTGVATITSATASFTAAIVGNLIYLTGTGVTTGWYQVVTFTNITTIVLDRSPGTFTGATMNIGGALDTLATAFGPAVACNTVWIKNTGTMTVTSQISTSLRSGNFNSGGAYFGIIGYGTTRGDGVKVTWTTSTNSTNLFEFSYGGANGGGFLFQNLIMSCTAGTPGAGALFVPNNGGHVYCVVVRDCVIDGFVNGISALSYGNVDELTDIVVENTEIKNSTGYGVVNTGGSFINCYIHDNAGGGINLVNGADTAFTCFLLRSVV